MNAYVLEDEDWRVQFFVKIGVPRERIFREPKALLEAVSARDTAMDESLVIFLDGDEATMSPHRRLRQAEMSLPCRRPLWRPGEHPHDHAEDLVPCGEVAVQLAVGPVEHVWPWRQSNVSLHRRQVA